jgi:histone H3/H4
MSTQSETSVHIPIPESKKLRNSASLQSKIEKNKNKMGAPGLKQVGSGRKGGKGKKKLPDGTARHKKKRTENARNGFTKRDLRHFFEIGRYGAIEYNSYGHTIHNRKTGEEIGTEDDIPTRISKDVIVNVRDALVNFMTPILDYAEAVADDKKRKTCTFSIMKYAIKKVTGKTIGGEAGGSEYHDFNKGPRFIKEPKTRRSRSSREKTSELGSSGFPTEEEVAEEEEEVPAEEDNIEEEEEEEPVVEEQQEEKKATPTQKRSRKAKKDVDENAEK